MLADEFNKAIGTRYVPGGSKMRLCGVDVLEAHACHRSRQVQEQLRYGIASLLHDQGVFCHAEAAAVFAAQIQGVRHHVAGEQAQTFGQMHCERIELIGRIGGRQVK